MSGSAAIMSITPFAADGSIDDALLRAHLARFVPHPVSVYVCSQGSGEGLALSTDEKAQVYRAAVDVLGGRREVVGAGIGLTGDTDSALADIERLSATGVDAVQVLPPRPGALRPSDREIEHYFDEVVGVARCPVVLGENVTLVGYEIGAALVRRIIERHDAITGLSYTVPLGSLAGLTDVITALRDRVAIRTGMLHHLANVAAAGGAGVLCFDGNVAPGLVAAAWDAASGGGDLLATLGPLLALNSALTRFGNPMSIKAALDHLGLPAGGLRRPFLGLDDPSRADLAARIDRLEAAFGLARWF